MSIGHSKVSRRKFLKYGAAAVGAAVIAGGAYYYLSQPAIKKTNITIKWGYAPVIAHTEVFVAKDKGFFDRYGLNVEMNRFASGVPTLQAMSSGSLDFSHPPITTALALAAKGTYPVLVHTAEWMGVYQGKYYTEGGLLVRNNVNANAFQDLVGMKVGVGALQTVNQACFEYILKKRGVDPSKVNIINVPWSNEEEALKSGSLDAAMMLEPFVTKSVMDGGLKFLSGEKYQDEMTTALTDFSELFPIAATFTTQEFASKNPDALHNVARALSDATNWMYANPDEWYAIAAKWSGVDASIVKASLLRGPLWRTYPDGFTDWKTMQGSLQLMQQAGYISGTIDLKKLVTTPYFTPQ